MHIVHLFTCVDNHINYSISLCSISFFFFLLLQILYSIYFFYFPFLITTSLLWFSTSKLSSPLCLLYLVLLCAYLYLLIKQHLCFFHLLHYLVLFVHLFVLVDWTTFWFLHLLQNWRNNFYNFDGFLLLFYSLLCCSYKSSSIPTSIILWICKPLLKKCEFNIIIK